MNIIQFGHARHRVFTQNDLIQLGYSPNTRLGSLFHFCVPCNLYTYGTWWQKDISNQVTGEMVVCRSCFQASEKVLSEESSEEQRDGNQK